MNTSVRNVAALAGIALVVAAIITTWHRWGPQRAISSPEVVRPRVSPQPVSGSTTGDEPCGAPHDNGDLDHHLPRPERPQHSELTKQAQIEMQRYLQELWIYCAHAARQELDGIILSRGAHAALDHVRGLTLPGAYVPIPCEGARSHVLVADDKILATFNYEVWFHCLLSVRLIPHVASRDSSPEVLRQATDLVLGVMKDARDPLLARFAASVFTDEESYATPYFAPAARVNGGQPIGLAFRFNAASPSYNQTKGFNVASETLNLLRLSLTPMLKDCPWATQGVAQTIERCSDDSVKRLLLRIVSSLPEWQQYGSIFLDLATSPEVNLWVRSDALSLLTPYASSRVLREAVDVGVSRVTDSDTREMFIEHLPQLYPLDHRYGDALQGFVRDGSEDEWVRVSSAKALIAYSTGQMPDPGIRATLDGYLGELVRNAKWDELQEVSDQIVSLRATQFVETYRSLLATLELSQNLSAEVQSGKEMLRSYLEEIDPVGDH